MESRPTVNSPWRRPGPLAPGDNVTAMRGLVGRFPATVGVLLLFDGSEIPWCSRATFDRGVSAVLRSSAVDLSEGEYILETTHPVAETGDHGRRPKLPSTAATPVPSASTTANAEKSVADNFRRATNALYARFVRT